MNRFELFLSSIKASKVLGSFDPGTANVDDLRAFSKTTICKTDLIHKYPSIVEKIISKYHDFGLGMEMPILAEQILKASPKFFHAHPFVVSRLVTLCDNKSIPDLFDEVNKDSGFLKTYPKLVKSMVSSCAVEDIPALTEKISANDMLDISMGKYIVNSHSGDCSFVPKVLKIFSKREGGMHIAVAKHALEKVFFMDNPKLKLVSSVFSALPDSFLLTQSNGFLGYAFSKLQANQLSKCYKRLPKHVKSRDWVNSLYKEAKERCILRRNIESERRHLRHHMPRRSRRIDDCSY